VKNKIILKISVLFTICIVVYLIFIIFFLSPIVNNYLVKAELKNTKSYFDNVVSLIDKKSKEIGNQEELKKEIELLLKTSILYDTGYIYLVKDNGKVIFDPSGEFKNQEELGYILPESGIKLFDEIKNSYIKKDIFKYFWNKSSDLNNFKYKKISFVEYNKDLNFYIIASFYEDELLSLFDEIDTLILETSILLFIILSFIGVFITLKMIIPVNKIFDEIEKIDNLSNEIKVNGNSKNEISFLVEKINALVNQVINNKETLEEQVQKKTKEIENRLYYDNLTNLRNRYALEDDIKNDDFVYLSLIDIDSFDNINELYGFPIGNLVLIEVAKLLNEFALKYNVMAYRIYGNVYCLVDNKMMGFIKYEKFIEDLGSFLKNCPVYIKELDMDIFINVTLGISIAQEEPIKTAAIALKKAKKNNLPYFVYNNEIDTKEIIEKSIYWRDKIKNAIELGNVLPFYQPIYDKNKNIVKYETLMRIKDINEKGEIIYLSPNLFLDVSIKTKQYLQLSYQVISKALVDLIRTDKQISINISFKDILDNEFIVSLDDSLEKIDSKDKERIVFEILESDYISDYSLLEDFIIKYRKQGIKTAIDDFGTGYSNFAHILKIRPNYIKIDGSLIKNLNKDRNSYEMVKSVVEFSKALDIKTIAEYIHSKEVFDLALELGIDEFQGFYLAEPSIELL
jgi:EAL domain-containing protein (putative c-di-GMP-specific phosphodiesterase class I)